MVAAAGALVCRPPQRCLLTILQAEQRGGRGHRAENRPAFGRLSPEQSLTLVAVAGADGRRRPGRWRYRACDVCI